MINLNKGDKMKKIFIVVLSFFCLTMMSASCKEKGGVKMGSKNSEPVLAKINNKEITLTEFNDRLKEVPQLAQKESLSLETKKGLLDNLVVRELLYQDALKTGIDKEKDTAFLVEEMKMRVVVDRYFKKEIDDKVKVTEDDVKTFYKEHPEEAKTPDEVRASHILLKTKEEAEMIKKKLKEGSKFEDLAKKYSLDHGSKETGGDLGLFSKGMMVPEFEEAAFKLKVGEVSDIVQTQFGFHIIKIKERKEGKIKNYDEVKKDLENSLINKKRKDRFDTLVAELKAKGKITINEDLLKGDGTKTPSDDKPVEK